MKMRLTPSASNELARFDGCSFVRRKLRTKGSENSISSISGEAEKKSKFTNRKKGATIIHILDILFFDNDRFMTFA